MRDCQEQGHILVDDDLECLACDNIVQRGEQVAIHYQRHGGELLAPADIAHPDEWGGPQL